MMTAVKAIVPDMSVRTKEYNWNVVLGENGAWGYTTSTNYKIGGPVEFEMRDKEFVFYCVRRSWKR